MKVPIRDIARFVNEGWPGPEWYMDDCGPAWDAAFWDDGNPRRPEEIVKLEDFECAICWQGVGDDPTQGSGKSFVKEFRKWYKGLRLTQSQLAVSAETIEDLRRQLAEAQRQLDDERFSWHARIALTHKAEAELAAAKRDTELLDWMFADVVKRKVYLEEGGYVCVNSHAKTPRAAIVAAMGKEPHDDDSM